MNKVLIDASGQILGRLASKTAIILRGKNKPTFMPNLLVGDSVIIYNAKNIKISGKKPEQKKYYSHSGYLGNLKTKTYKNVLSQNPSKIIQHAIAGMLPKNRLKKEMLKKLTVLEGNYDDKK